MMHKTTKRYTVNTKKETCSDGKNYEVFTNLRLARIFAREQYRIKNLVSLLNFKRIPLPI